jgi:hypothetical protein
MDISKMIADLRGERDRLDEAISSLEKLSPSGTPRRGRPPAWNRADNSTAPRSRNGQNGSTNRVNLSPEQN